MPGWRAGPSGRTGSPPGISTLITSAPMSPRIWVATGPNTADVKSTTRMPECGPDMLYRLHRNRTENAGIFPAEQGIHGEKSHRSPVRCRNYLLYQILTIPCGTLQGHRGRGFLTIS